MYYQNKKTLAKANSSIYFGNNIMIEPSLGLCLNALFNLDNDYVRRLSKKWEHYSGVPEYPITIDKLDPRFLYGRKNLYQGIYGKMRIKFAKYLLKHMKKDLKKLKESKDDQF